MPETISIINGVLMGGAGVAVVNAVSKGLARRASARGRKMTGLDAALRTIDSCFAHIYKVRDIAREHGARDLPDPPRNEYADLISKEDHQS